MKTLTECKEYYKDMYMDVLAVEGFEKSRFECAELAEYNAHRETLGFVYGAEFDRIERIWKREALNEYYTLIANA